MFELNPALNALPLDFIGPKGRSVHLIGIGGVAMTALAGLLKEKGLAVTGSDLAMYPPMSDILREMEATVFEGYGPETLPEACDLVVVGNVVTRKFPVLEKVKERGLPYLSLPQTLGALFLNHTKNLVVAGCHGKTSTTALAAKIWEEAGMRPGFLIGGAALDFPKPWRIAGGECFIIEGDEYDSAFFNKVPKFIHYRPHTVILTSVEFDHADIYPDLAAVIAAFESLMERIPPDGRLIAWGDDPLVRKVAAKCKAPVEFYGQNEDNDWRVLGIEETGAATAFELTGPEGFYARLSLSRPGVYNALNAAAAAAAFVGAGGDSRFLASALANFKGVKRRQEFLGEFSGIMLIDDFAHHPTAVEKTLAAIKRANPGRRVLTAFEPRSNTSRRAVFQNDYVKALAGADRIFLRSPVGLEKSPEGDRLSAPKLAADLGPQCALFEDGRILGEAIVAEAASGDIVLIMSNGGFDGLAEYLKGHLGGK